MSEPYPISITKAGDAIVCSIDMWRDVQEKIDRFFAERTDEEAVRQLREIGFERVVRCRDCKYYTPESMTREERGFGVYEDVWEPGGCFNPERCSHGGDPFGEWYVVGINTEPDGFCAWGERRDA